MKESAMTFPADFLTLTPVPQQANTPPECIQEPITVLLETGLLGPSKEISALALPNISVLTTRLALAFAAKVNPVPFEWNRFSKTVLSLLPLSINPVSF